MPKNGSYKKEKVMLIASYREEYNKEALSKIKHLILKEHPDRIIISKIIEDEETPEVVKATVGIEEENDFLDSVLEEKKHQIDEYSVNLIKMAEATGTPTEVRLRKGEEISDEIVSDCENMNVDIVVMHGKKKGMLRTVFEGSTKEKVEKEIPQKNVIPVD
ncbi:MAG: universal stress protein [Thermoplasmatota archaeon]